MDTEIAGCCTDRCELYGTNNGTKIQCHVTTVGTISWLGATLVKALFGATILNMLPQSHSWVHGLPAALRFTKPVCNLPCSLLLDSGLLAGLDFAEVVVKPCQSFLVSDL